MYQGLLRIHRLRVIKPNCAASNSSSNRSPPLPFRAIASLNRFSLFLRLSKHVTSPKPTQIVVLISLALAKHDRLVELSVISLDLASLRVREGGSHRCALRSALATRLHYLSFRQGFWVGKHWMRSKVGLILRNFWKFGSSFIYRCHWYTCWWCHVQFLKATCTYPGSMYHIKRCYKRNRSLLLYIFLVEMSFTYMYSTA